MSSKCSLKLFIDNIPAFEESLKTLVEAIKQIAENAAQVADSIRSLVVKVDGMKGDVKEVRKKLSKYEELLLKIRKEANNFIDNVKDCLKYGELNKVRQCEIKQLVKNGKLVCLNAYLRQLARLFRDCKTSYDSFEKVCKTSNEVCTAGVQLCAANMKDAEDSKWTTQLRGGLIAGTTAVVGVVGVAGIATVAGLFTFGIGAPIVLGLAGAGSGAALAGGATTTAVTSIMTHNSATSYQHAADVFKEVSDGFCRIKGHAGDIDVAITTLHEILKDVDIDRQMVSGHDPDNYEAFCRAFDIMMDGFSRAHREVHMCNKKMQGKEQKIE